MASIRNFRLRGRKTCISLELENNNVTTRERRVRECLLNRVQLVLLSPESHIMQFQTELNLK